MQERERAIVTGLVLFLLLLWLGFLVHVDPRFAGSATGILFGVIAFVLLLVPAAYSLIKRLSFLRTTFTRWISMRTFLAWHIYASILGGILAIGHSGHRFDSRIGVLLISMTLLVILSGFIGRYLMAQIDRELKEKYALLDRARLEYSRAAQQVRERSNAGGRLAGYRSFLFRVWSPASWRQQISGAGAVALEWRAVQLAESIADLEYAAKTHEIFKLWFSRWLRFHIAISALLYAMIAFHVSSEIYLGLRWFS